MTKEIDELSKAIALGTVAVDLLQKSHVKEHTRTSKSGAVSTVKEHDDSRHPNIIGKADKVEHNGELIHFEGKPYYKTDTTGNSMHDGRPVTRYEHGETGHQVWLDDKNNIHADSKEEAQKYHQKAYEEACNRDWNRKRTKGIADETSEKAERFNTKDWHDKAAAAHVDAHQWAKDGHPAKAYHSQMAEYHRSEAKKAKD